MIHLFSDEDNYLFAEEMTDSLHLSGLPTELHPVGYAIPDLPPTEVVHFIGSYYLDWVLDALSSYRENPVLWSPAIQNYNYKSDAAIDCLGIGFATVNEWRQSEIHKIGQILSKLTYLCCFSSQELGFMHGLGGIPSPVQPCYIFTPLLASYVKIPEPPQERIVFYDDGKVDNGLDLLLRKNGVLDLLQTEIIEFLLVRRTREFWDDYDGQYQEKLTEILADVSKRHPITVEKVKTEGEALRLLMTGKVLVDLHSWVSNPAFHLCCFSGGREIVASYHGCLMEYLGGAEHVHYITPLSSPFIAHQIAQAYSQPYYHPASPEVLQLTQEMHQQQLSVWHNFYQAVQTEREVPHGA